MVPFACEMREVWRQERGRAAQLERAGRTYGLARAPGVGEVMPHDPEIAALKQRLDLLPELMDFDHHTQVAAAIGVPYEAWSHTVRTGDLSFPTAKKIVKAIPGLNLDWLAFGHKNGLTVQMAQKIARLQTPDDEA